MLIIYTVVQYIHYLIINNSLIYNAILQYYTYLPYVTWTYVQCSTCLLTLLFLQYITFFLYITHIKLICWVIIKFGNEFRGDNFLFRHLHLKVKLEKRRKSFMAFHLLMR